VTEKGRRKWYKKVPKNLIYSVFVLLFAIENNETAERPMPQKTHSSNDNLRSGDGQCWRATRQGIGGGAEASLTTVGTSE
jgi:hypothetical protein